MKGVWATNIYVVGALAALFYYDLGRLALFIFGSVCVLLYCVAALADAVFDSLSERVNIQSPWLDVRLGVLEKAARADSGPMTWMREVMPTDDPSHYFRAFPEQKLDPDTVKR
jgi:hypothetical protein